MASHHDSTSSEVVRWQPQQRELVPSSVGTSHPDLVKHTGKMASDNQPYDGFTKDDLENFENEQIEYELLLDISAKSGRKPRNQKQRLMMEHLAKEKAQKNLNKNKWMVLSPINKPPQYSIEAQFDTGAVLNFITERMVQLMGLEKKRLDPPREINTAAGPGGECEFHVFANWRGRPGCGGRVEFFVLPETSPLTKPLIGRDGQECWNGLLDEEPKDAIYWTTLSKEKAPEKIEGAALRTTVLNQQSQLQRTKEAQEERVGSSSSKSKGSRSNEKKTRKN